MMNQSATEVDAGCSASFAELVVGRGRKIGPTTGVLVGMLPGEGIGPELTEHAIAVLAALASKHDFTFKTETGGPIGLLSEQQCGQALSDEVTRFCQGVTARGGAILAGPGGSRFVYDLRRRLDLYVKFSPLLAWPELRDVGPLKADRRDGVDIIVVRDNIAGVYQGISSEVRTSDQRVVRHEFGYRENEVSRLMEVGARLAAQRSGQVTLVVKSSGVPAISRLWTDVGQRVCSAMGVRVNWLDVDYCVYRLMERANEWDVVITPNLIGDVLADLGAVLVGSRGLTFSGNYSATGAAVYQTNHGSAYDMVGQDMANPGGHLLALAMMLRHSFGQAAAAETLENAMRQCWREGWRTVDIAQDGRKPVGTAEFVQRVISHIGQ